MEQLLPDMLVWLETILLDWLASLQMMLLAANKRVFVGYLVSAVLVALIWFYWRHQWTISHTFKQLFNRQVWWSSSARLDYLLVLVNQAVMLLLRPFLLGKLLVATTIYYAMTDWVVPIHWTWVGYEWLVPMAYTLVLFLLDDASRYYLHRLMHRWPVLWALHRLHHSAETLTPFTVLRTHPLEAVLFGLRSALVQGIVTGAFVYLFADKVSLLGILGANGIIVIFNILGANLRHSHVPLSYGNKLEKWLVSPAQHQLHHSKDVAHYDRNFGVALAIWDRLGGTWLAYEPQTPLQFGVNDQYRQHSNLWQAYWQPVEQSAQAIKRAVHSLFAVKQSDLKYVREVGMMIKKTLKWLFVIMTLVSIQATYAAQVNVYSARKEALIKPILDAFTEQTGIQVKLLTGKADALLTRLRVEGAYTPADVFITVDAGRLHRAKEANVLQPLQAEAWLDRVPVELRDDANYWVGLTMRARPIMYAPERVDISELGNYEDLANEQWQGRLCLRSSEAVYNQSLVAATLHALGEEATLDWLQGMVANLAIPPAGGDIDQIKNVAAGQCDVTMVNTYYLGRMINSDLLEERQVAEQVKVFWPNQDNRGAHFNVSGAGITKHATNVKEANVLLDFLTSSEAQRWYAEINNEYPVVGGVESSSTLAAFGQAKRDPIALQILGENNAKAVQLMDQASWR